MQISKALKIRRPVKKHQAETSKQTGFPSPATHYQEAVIDLNAELVTNKDATFFVRIKGNDLCAYNIQNNDVLIIDRSIAPKANQLALVIVDGEFIVRPIPSKSKETEFLLWGIITYIIHSTR